MSLGKIMTQIERHGEPSCAAGCSRCGAEPSARQVLTGWRFGLSAAVTFLAPLALAIAGAIAGGPGGAGELAGGVCGLVIGAAAAVAAVRVFGLGLGLGRRSDQAR